MRIEREKKRRKMNYASIAVYTTADDTGRLWLGAYNRKNHFINALLNHNSTVILSDTFHAISGAAQSDSDSDHRKFSSRTHQRSEIFYHKESALLMITNALNSTDTLLSSCLAAPLTTIYTRGTLVTVHA